MIERVLTEDMIDELIRGEVNKAMFKADRAYKEVSTEHWTKKTTKTLVEDDKLIDDLYEYCQGRWTIGFVDIDEDSGEVIHDLSRPLSKENIKKMMFDKYLIHCGLNKISEDGYELDWHDGSRWENDYNLDGAYYSVRAHSFSDVLSEFIADNPNKVKFEIREEWIKEEERY